jgi:uncharacterized membrane protein YeaQ/YmgE (transglycosylase-associated protein family)
MFGSLSNESLIWFLIIGVVAGWLAGRIMRGGGFGLVGDLVVGVVGAFLGNIVATYFGVHIAGLAGTIITATLGAIVLLAAVRMIHR